MKTEKVFLIIFILGTLIINYSYFDSLLTNYFDDSEVGFVNRVIDGDTVVVGNYSIRLLGINSPEKGEIGYDNAKNFLINEVLGKEVKLVFGKNKFDKYKRKLSYIFFEGQNINLKSVEEGYSNIYFLEGKNKYYPSFSQAWKSCLDKNINLCENSKDNCIILEEWDTKNQVVVLKNICKEEINLDGWSVKDEGRKKYTFKEKILSSEEKLTLLPEDWNETYIWTKTGDSIFVRDKEGKLVIWDSY